MQELARHAREEVKNSFREVRQAVNVVSAFTSGKEKPPLPPKYVHDYINAMNTLLYTCSVKPAKKSRMF